MRKEGRGRRGGEKRRGIVIGGMVLSLLIGCNNGEIEQLGKRNQFLSSLANLGNEFLNVFTSFGDMISGETLGFNAETPKSKVGDYFKKVKETVEATKISLERIVENMEKEGNPNTVAVKTKVEALIKDKLNNIIEGANKVKEAIGDDTGLIADFGSSGVGVPGDSNVVKSISEGIKMISDMVLKGKGQADAGNLLNPAVDSTGVAGSVRDVTTDNANNGALAIFNKKAITDSRPGAGKAAQDVAKAVGAVTGVDILKAISEGLSGNAAKLAIHNASTISEGTPIAAANAKDATIAGGIALRAMAKGGKFSNKSDGSDVGAKQQIKDAAIGAVTKALNELTIAIRKTIDEGLKTVKDAMNINPNDTPVTTEAKN